MRIFFPTATYSSNENVDAFERATLNYLANPILLYLLFFSILSLSLFSAKQQQQQQL